MILNTVDVLMLYVPILTSLPCGVIEAMSCLISVMKRLI